MPHILGPMTPEEFYTDAQVGKFRLTHIFEMHRGEHPLQKIHAKLVQYHNMQKQFLEQRHDLLIEITGMCVAYAGAKPPEKLTSKKLQCVFRLGNQCAARVVLEEERARELQRRLTAPIIGIGRARGGGGVRVGGPSSASRELRFERLNKPGQASIRGDDLLALAEERGCPLTGDETRDFYSMKKLIKVLKTEHSQKLDLLYMSAEQRERYRLIIYEDGLIRYPREPWTTDSEGYIYACSLAGVFYAGLDLDIRKDFPELRGERGIGQWRVQHSSFLAGGDVMGAGTICVKNGRLRLLSNNSGHYGPTLANLWDCCVAMKENGAYVDEAYAYICDFQKECIPTKVSEYMVPLNRFVSCPRGRMYEVGWVNYEIAEVKGPEAGGQWHPYRYLNVDAARMRGCRKWLRPEPIYST